MDGAQVFGPKDWYMRNLTPNTSFNSIQEGVYGNKELFGWQLVFLGDIEEKELILKNIQKFPTQIDEIVSYIIENGYISLRRQGCVE